VYRGCAPWPEDEVWQDGMDYLEWVIHRCVEVTRMAGARKAPARLAAGRIRFAFNRRRMQADGYVGMGINPSGPCVRGPFRPGALLAQSSGLFLTTAPDATI
jgi:hypothetical protein